ncbi:MAG: hypothetical protein JNG84_05350 [Archangium sp.]|nr:hypothetical protein [Archangium sp.]
MRRTTVKWACVAVALALSATAAASTLIPHTLRQRAQASSRVAVVRVIGQRVETRDDGRPVKTVTDVEVLDGVKGSGAKRLAVVQVGGVANGYTMRVPGDARFEVGETCLVFLTCDDARCGLVALGEGKLALRDGRVEVHDLFTQRWSTQPLEAVLRELRSAK